MYSFGSAPGPSESVLRRETTKARTGENRTVFIVLFGMVWYA